MSYGFSFTAPQMTLPERDAEFDALTTEEKEIVYRDLYGTANNYAKEDDDVIENGLMQFEMYLNELDDKECYLRALEISPDYAQDKNLRLQFLRCELFDAKLAAIRFVRFWKEKVELWGEDRAFHKVTFEYLDETDLSVLGTGVFQGLKERDKFNRCILVLNRSRLDHHHRNSTIRVMWYILESFLESVETQRNGIVVLSGLHQDNLQIIDLKLTSWIMKVVRYALPVRIVAIHSIIRSRIMQFTLPYILYLFGAELRHRYKTHSNPNLAFNELEKYGISKMIIPKELGGSSLFSLQDWIEEQKERKRYPLSLVAL